MKVTKKNLYKLLCILHLCLSGCLDYIKMDSKSAINESFNFPPTIDFNKLAPNPRVAASETISVGKNCKGQVFYVPPIKDSNPEDKLHYVWLFDSKLVPIPGVIEPEFRQASIPLRLEVNKQFLISLYETKIPKNFFDKSHVIEFYVSDGPFLIPDNATYNEKHHGAYVYWIINFSNDPC